MICLTDLVHVIFPIALFIAVSLKRVFFMGTGFIFSAMERNLKDILNLGNLFILISIINSSAH